MKHLNTNHQRGVALISALMVLLLLTALAAGLVMMSNTETGVNSNFVSEKSLYSGAKAGVEEARDRLMAGNASPLVPCNPTSLCTSAATPVVPSSANGGILYILGGPTPASVTPWTPNTLYTDDELCHDGYALAGLTAQSSDVRCTTVPTGTAWNTTTNSTAPWNGTSAALPYQWVRVSWKLNNSITNYPVDSTQPSATTPVCYNGAQEVLLNAANCSLMSPAATPVYLITALAVNLNTGARKMVQAEAALPPPIVTSVPGFYATSKACPAFTMSGGATTDSYNSHNGDYTHTKATTGGGIGTNGQVNMSGNKTQVGGNITAANSGNPACSPGISTSGGAGVVTGTTPPNTMVTPATPATFPAPPAPNPLPPTTNLQNPNPPSLVPGNYGNINLSGGTTLTLAPGVYNINSISLSGNSVISISPAGPVVLNVAGQGVNNPIDFSGGSLTNTNGMAANFQMNYGGTGNVNLSGGSGMYAVVNAPNASVKFTGGSDFFGSVIGATMDDSGGVALHYDTAVQSNTNSPTTIYSQLSFREVTY